MPFSLEEITCVVSETVSASSSPHRCLCVLCIFFGAIGLVVVAGGREGDCVSLCVSCLGFHLYVPVSVYVRVYRVHLCV